MKTITFKTRWMLPVLAIAWVGGYPLAKTYLGYGASIQVEAQFGAACNDLSATLDLNHLQREVQSAGVEAASRQNWWLSARNESLKARLAAADGRTRVLAEAVFDHLARVQSPASARGASLTAGLSPRAKALPKPLSTASPRP
jgi:hypothetical protein